MQLDRHPLHWFQLSITSIAMILAACGGGSGGSSSGGGGGSRASSPEASVPSTSTDEAPVVVDPAVVAPTVTPPGSPSAITVSLSANQVSGVAPLSVFFDATGTESRGITSMPFHDIKYTWDFDDVANFAGWSYGSRVGLSSKNSAHGPVAAHVFETPGTYAVKVTAFDGTNTNSKTITINVTSQDDAFSGANTICIANGTTPQAGVNGCPIGAAVRNINSASVISTLANASNKRLLLKRGDSWNVDSYSNTNGFNIILGAYGSGAAPVIRTTTANHAFQLVTGARQWTFMDVKFLGTTSASPAPIGTSGSGFRNLTLLRVESELTGGFTFSTVDGLFVVDCNGFNYRGGNGHVGVYSEMSSRVAILGNRIYDATQIEHNIRMQGNFKAVVSNNTLYGPAVTKQALTIRGRSEQYAGHAERWSGVWAEHFVVSDNDIDAGPNAGQLVQFAPQNTDSNEPVRDAIFERNYVHGNVGTLIVTEASSGMTIRNNLLASSDNHRYASGVIYVLYKNTVGVAAPTGTYIYNNTFYRPAGSTPSFEAIAVDREQSGGLPATGLPTGTIVKNNLVYAPYSTSNDYTAWPGPVFIGSYTNPNPSWTLANNSSDFQIKNTAPGFVTPPLNSRDWQPTGGSYGVRTGTIVPVWDDFFLTSRTGAASLGAVLP